MSGLAQEVIKVADMQKDMIEEALRVSKQAISTHDIEIDIAKHIKTHFDSKYS